MLTELIPAPMAIADEDKDEDEYIRLISAGTNKPDVLADFSPPPEE